jgi:hypothetical protein
LAIAEHGFGDQYGGDIAWKDSPQHDGGRFYVGASDALDSDHDGLSDYAEQMYNGSGDYDPRGTDTDINNPDTDGDEMTDGWEVNNGLNPLLNDASGNGDGDQLSNYQEWIAGTSPTNGNSTFRIDGIAIVTNEFSPVIYWQSVSGRYYSVHSKSNLTDVSWDTNQSRRFSQGGMLSYTNLNAAQTHFYRISVENE